MHADLADCGLSHDILVRSACENAFSYGATTSNAAVATTIMLQGGMRSLTCFLAQLLLIGVAHFLGTLKANMLFKLIGYDLRAYGVSCIKKSCLTCLKFLIIFPTPWVTTRLARRRAKSQVRGSALASHQEIFG